ncbi:K(+)-transporting ATPase subunit F [Leucobacter sp. cx-42]|nr:K(+)-transporting ATPase subunit F [Leucobacter sp. cx-42]
MKGPVVFDLIAATLAVAAIGYLVVALLKPEKF